jgi:hypothetical protein
MERQHLVAMKEGHGTLFQQISGPVDKQSLRLQLRPEHAINGVVLNESQQPVSNAVVTVYSLWTYDRKELFNGLKTMVTSGDESWLNSRDMGVYLKEVPRFTTTTDREGKFRLSGSPEDTLAQLIITSRGHVLTYPLVVASPIFVEDGKNDQQISATQLQRAHLQQIASTRNETLEQAQARIELIRRHRVLEPSELKLVLMNAVTVEGYARDLQGKPQAGIMVSGYGHNSTLSRTDSSGHYVLEGLAPSETFELKPGEHRELDNQLLGQSPFPRKQP